MFLVDPIRVEVLEFSVSCSRTEKVYNFLGFIFWHATAQPSHCKAWAICV